MPTFMQDLLNLLEQQQTPENRFSVFYNWILNEGIVLSEEEYILVTRFCDSLDRTDLNTFYGI